MSKLESRELELLLQDFYYLTNIKICLYDLDGNELFYYPNQFSRFCELLRADPEMDRKCQNCDKAAFEHCKRTQAQYHYTCHAGLQECISPILYHGEVVGFMMLGQIKKSNAHALPVSTAELPRELVPALKSSYEQLPTISDQKLRAALHILDACTGYELLKNYVQSHQSGIDAQIKQYIRENLAQSISVVQLCSKFHLSHYEIYRIFKEYFFCSPAEYVKKERLQAACGMLAGSDLPIHEIATLCGISDYNYFSKVFKSAYGISPTAYRLAKR